ncbi:MAG TPA: protein translocase subunit SecD [Miltoncostaeaceae bacterium]|nr:protein translocase subunit SecD [Miltoncostaeaceae bacterium]
MRRPMLLLAIVVGLVAASAIAIAVRPTVLGLDLQGGVEVVLQGKPTEQAQVTKQAIDRSVEIIRDRVDAFGVAEPEIQTQGNDQIVVSLPGANNPDKVVRDLINPAQLVFIPFEKNVVGPLDGSSLYDAAQLAARTKPDDVHGLPTFYAFDKTTKRAVAGPESDLATLKESFPNNAIPPSVEVVKVPAGLFLASQETQRFQTRESGTEERWFVFQNNPGLTGQDISSASALLETQGIGGSRWIVTMKFTGDGREKFQDLTRQLAVDGNLQNQLQRFAIILDGKIVSNPTVDYNDYPAGIDGRNGAQIEGDFSQDEAQTLAKQINSGALPIQLEVISQKQVSATLGKQSLHQALIAGIVGLALVILFLVAYYRFLGLVAALGLVIYAVLLYAVVVLIPITLTLPGIAGIILTIGVASDANVVIFERVREEARAGKSPRAAILAGYKKGLSAIIDANVVTFATALILFLFASAGVKGFAFTLMIGVLLSLFTAVVATRAVFNVLAETRFLRDDRYMGLKQREIRWKLDFVGKWKLWMAISFIPLAIGAVYIGVNGLNLGLDFESGTRVEAIFDRPATEDGVRAVTNDLGLSDAKIQATTEQVDGQSVSGFQIQTQTLQPPALQDLRRGLDQQFGLQGGDFQTVDTVGPVLGEQIIRNAVWAILLSFAVIVLYLTIRFEYKLALPALLSVIHDVWLALAIYSVTGREVTSATVAALLTILGYSLYDVVIVFDRIRENQRIMRKSTYREIVNTSVHETLTRSIITSLTTLIPLTVLFFFGGDTLKDFAFALIVGILSGGLSSIAIAAPLAALWKEREPLERRRTAKAERRAASVASDSDVVDLEALARAEAALDAELRLENGGPADDEDEEEPRRLEAGEPEEIEEIEPEPVAEEPEPVVDDPDAEPAAEEPAAEPADEPAAEPSAEAEAEPAQADGAPTNGGPTAEDGAAAPVPAADEQAPRPRRERPSPDRQRRHRQVQKRRRR